jgi:hypothetical protein
VSLVGGRAVSSAFFSGGTFALVPRIPAATPIALGVAASPLESSAFDDPSGVAFDPEQSIPLLVDPWLSAEAKEAIEAEFLERGALVLPVLIRHLFDTRVFGAVERLVVRMLAPGMRAPSEVDSSAPTLGARPVLVVDGGLGVLGVEPKRALPALVAEVPRGRARIRRGLPIVHLLAGPADRCGDALESTWREDFERVPEGSWSEGEAHAGFIVHRTGGGRVGIHAEDEEATRRLFMVPKAEDRAQDAWVRSEREFCDVEIEISVRELQEIHGLGTFGATMIGWDLTESADGERFYALSIGREGWALARIDPRGVRLLSGGASPSFGPGSWRRLGISQLGSSITLSVDGLLFEAASDPEPFLFGRVALGAEDAWVEFDDLEVRGSSLK